MLILRFWEKESRKEIGVCALSVLYVILVTLIPIVGLGGKGSATNTYIKAGILVAYLLLFLFKAKFRISISAIGLYMVFSYLTSQLYDIAFSAYVVSSLDVLIQGAMFFAILFLLPAMDSCETDIIKGIKIYVLFDIIAIVYNIVLHFSRYANLSFLTNVYYDMHSFFDNKNTYGMVLFIGLILLFYWYYICDNQVEKTLIRVLMCLQFLAIATSMCRTAVLCSFVFVFLNLFLRLTGKKLLWILVLIITSIVILSIPAVREYLLYVLFRVDEGTYREPIVEASIKIWRENVLFGSGQGSWEELLDKFSGNSYSHNGFLSILMTGGLVYFVAYCVMIVNALKRIIQIRKVHFCLGSQFLYAMIATLIYAFYEPVVLCEANASNFAFTTAILVIPQLYYTMYRREA